MNRSRLLMIGGLALAIGLLVSYSVYNRLRASSALNQNVGGVPVLVAANDIDVGAKLKASDVRLITLPPTSIPPGAFSSVVKWWAAEPFCPSREAILFCPANWRDRRRCRPTLHDSAGNARRFRSRQ